MLSVTVRPRGGDRLVVQKYPQVVVRTIEGFLQVSVGSLIKFKNEGGSEVRQNAILFIQFQSLDNHGYLRASTR